MNPDELAPNPLLALRLRGTQREMGAQAGELLRSIGGYEKAAAFYPTMAARLLSSAAPQQVRPAIETVAGVLLKACARRMEQHRRRRFPAYAERTEALLAAGGVSTRLSYAFLVMDVFQTTVGLLGRTPAFSGTPLGTAAVAACSSLAVWNSASSDSTLRHARNFDFPGASVWDHSPLVVFSEPDEWLRYGFVTTRGADVPGVTAFNEAGLTLTMHTRFHRDVRFEGGIGFDLSHEIVRRASTLTEAARIARECGAGSSWGLLVSSAKERSAIVIETSGRAVAVTKPTSNENHLACTNRYLDDTLARGEVTPTRALTIDSNARYAELNHVARSASSGLTPEELETLLGDLGNPNARDRRPDTARLAGDCIVSPISVQSIVAEPEKRQIRVSIGRSPTGLGPFVEVPWSFDGPVGVVDVNVAETPSRAKDHRGAPLSEADRETMRAYAEVARLHLEGVARPRIRELTEGLVRRSPREPNFRALAAFMSMGAGDLGRAAAHLDVALTLEGGSSRRARLLLWQTRVLVALGRTRQADVTRGELLAMSEHETLAERRAAEREHKKPISARTLRRIVPDFMLVDAALPGVRVH